MEQHSRGRSNCFKRNKFEIPSLSGESPPSDGVFGNREALPAFRFGLLKRVGHTWAGAVLLLAILLFARIALCVLSCVLISLQRSPKRSLLHSADLSGISRPPFAIGGGLEPPTDTDRLTSGPLKDLGFGYSAAARPATRR